VYNPLTVETLRKMQTRGGNALGIDPKDGPLTSKSPEEYSEGIRVADILL
jgi:hypothetical protein